MGLYEKRVPKYLSMAAIVASIAITGWLAIEGHRNPRKYLGSMSINHHGGYGTPLACQECHIVSGGPFSLHSELNCVTSGCHAALLSDTPEDEAERLAIENFLPMPDARQRALFFLDLHQAFRDRECWDCHTEHTTRPTFMPPGWTTYGPEKQIENAMRGDFVSINEV